MEFKSLYTPQYLKMRESDSKKRKVNYRTSRSINPQYRRIEKLQDITRFNSATNKVAHYQDFPNRSGTPIKPSSPRSQPAQQRSPHPYKYGLIKSLLGGQGPVRDEVKKGLIEIALQAPIRGSAPGPVIARHSTGRFGEVVSDFHSRETNPGYARNDFGGGFFTR